DAVNESLGYLNEATSVYNVRNLYKGADLFLNKENLGGARYTSGIVVSNHENGNFPEGRIAIESVWRGKIRGLILEVDDPLKYLAGDSVLVDIEGVKLSRNSGPLTLTGLRAG